MLLACAFGFHRWATVVAKEGDTRACLTCSLVIEPCRSKHPIDGVQCCRGWHLWGQHRRMQHRWR